MAKDRFYPKEPHVNVGVVTMNLMSAGISASGATQVANGQMPFDPSDQLRMVSLLQELAGDGTTQHFFTVEIAE